MIKSLVVGMMLISCLGPVRDCGAEELSIKAGDSIETLLEGFKGKRVTVRLQGNDELTGKVRTVTKGLVQLGELSGRDFYDAVIDTNRISALIVRVKEK